MTEKNVKYKKEAQDDVFFAELKNDVKNYFISHKIENAGGGLVLFKTFFFIFIFLGSYGLVISNWFTPFFTLIWGIICGLSSVFIVFNISHDASHDCLFKSKKINRLLTHTFELVGANAYTWHLAHNQIHHTYPNVVGKDLDIYQSAPFIRVAPSDPYFFYHKYQHIYATFIYMAHSIYLVFMKDFQIISLIPKSEFSLPKYKHPTSAYAVLFLSKLFYILYSLVIPMMVLDIIWWKILLSYILIHIIMSVLLGAVLIPVHMLDLNEFPKPNHNKIINHSWIRHVFQTTIDYSSDSKIANFFFGGLNTHLAHHIFPNICHVHLIRVTEIIKKAASHVGIPYHQLTMYEAIKAHFRLLKKMSIPSFK
ncbi:MAG: fatty acid desaturase [Saprospiraceae bacterium]|nr:fatty acid desaturase [Saprospiraceae bacterium]